MASWDYIQKHVIVGNAGTGKSCLLVRLTDHTFFSGSEPTIGVEFGSSLIELPNGKVVKTHAWDTAGQEAFRSITKSYYRGAEGALLCFDLTHRSSWLAVPQWLEDLLEYAEEGVVITLVGTKSDLITDSTPRDVSLEEIQAFAKLHGNLQYIETSSKTGDNVEEAFKATATLIHQRIEENKLRRPAKSSGSSFPNLAQSTADSLSGKGCC